jgi:hypothetical protein
MVLARLLTLNNRIHDLENLLRQTRLRVVGGGEQAHLEAAWPSGIAQLQQEIDRDVRASLVTCWLGMPDGADR